MDDVSINHVKNELKEQSSIKIVIYEFTCAKIMNVVILVVHLKTSDYR